MLNDALTDFDYAPRTRVIFGGGTLNRLGELARELGGQRALLVTDKGLETAGHPQRGEQMLREAGLSVTVFDDLQPNPTTADVQNGLEVARAADVDLIIGLGGGSSMDCAKGINFLFTNGGRMEDYWGVGKATKPMLPMIAVPTTAGTGSEAQSFALIAQADTHQKMACGDKKAACRVAILDPDLTESMPLSVASATGIDALSHALETHVTKPRNEISRLFSRRAWGLLAPSFLPSIQSGLHNSAARARMLAGSHFAGAAIENSMLGVTHSLANPLSAHFDITHGIAIGIMLPHVIRYNSFVVSSLYGELAEDVNLCDADDPLAGRRLADFVRGLVAEAGLPTTLSECQVAAAKLPLLAREAAGQWTANFNPRPVDVPALEELYRCAMSCE